VQACSHGQGNFDESDEWWVFESLGLETVSAANGTATLNLKEGHREIKYWGKKKMKQGSVDQKKNFLGVSEWGVQAKVGGGGKMILQYQIHIDVGGVLGGGGKPCPVGGVEVKRFLGKRVLGFVFRVGGGGLRAGRQGGAVQFWNGSWKSKARKVPPTIPSRKKF